MLMKDMKKIKMVTEAAREKTGMGVVASVRPGKRLVRRFLSLVLALNLLMNPLAMATVDDAVSGNVDPEVAEVSGVQSGGAMEGTPEETIYSFSMGDAGSVMLSRVIAGASVPVGMENIMGVAAMGSAGEFELDSGELISVEPVENDYIIHALRSFTKARMAIYSADSVYKVDLLDGIVADPVTPEVVASEGPVESEITVQAEDDVKLKAPRIRRSTTSFSNRKRGSLTHAASAAPDGCG